MRILLLTPFFPPEMGAPQARYYELALRLQRMGHEVTVLTAFPNYPTGRIYEGYRGRVRMEEEMDGIRVIRTWIFPSKSANAMVRMLSAMSFVLSSTVLGLWGVGKQDVTVFGSPPLFMVLAGVAQKYLRRSKLMMYVADIWPDIFVRMGKLGPGLTLRGLFLLERFGYRNSDVVALTTPGAREQIRERFPEVETTVLSNGVDTSLFRPELRSEHLRRKMGAGPDDFLVGYIGLHGLAQGLMIAIKAAERLRDRKQIQFIMIGDGVEKESLMASARDRGLTNIRFWDPVPKSEVPGLLASCDASLVPLVVRLPGTMPSKAYEALAAGVPPLVVKHCEGERLVEQFGVGKTFEPMDDAELATAIRELADNPKKLENMKRNCRLLADGFNRDLLAEWMHMVLQAMHERSPLPEVEWGGRPPQKGRSDE